MLNYVKIIFADIGFTQTIAFGHMFTRCFLYYFDECYQPPKFVTNLYEHSVLVKTQFSLEQITPDYLAASHSGRSLPVISTDHQSPVSRIYLSSVADWQQIILLSPDSYGANQRGAALWFANDHSSYLSILFGCLAVWLFGLLDCWPG